MPYLLHTCIHQAVQLLQCINIPWIHIVMYMNNDINYSVPNSSSNNWVRGTIGGGEDEGGGGIVGGGGGHKGGGGVWSGGGPGGGGGVWGGE